MDLSSEKRFESSISKVQTRLISKLPEIFELMSEQPWDSVSKRNRSPFFYRGLSNSAYQLQTTLQRVCGPMSSNLEAVILRNFAKYAIFQDPHISDSIWRQMVLGQHHGLPTRLLDWTYSPLVALHFAVNDANPKNIQNTDCVVWRIDANDVVANLPDSYRNVLRRNKANIFTIEMLQELATSTEQFDNEMSINNSIVLLEPPSIDQRIINQYSYFTVIPKHINCLEDYIATNMPGSVRYVISKELKWRIRDMLDQMNINERTLFPGFDGLATWLKRYYFVDW